MHLRHLLIYNYKNIAEADLALSSNVNCFVGHNGEGKTNVLDAVYFLSFCRSCTTNIDSLIVRHGADCMALTGDYELDGADEKIVCSLKPKQRKLFKHNGKDYKRLTEHIGKVRLVMVSPSDQELILGGSELRRKFMDMVISQYDADYLQQLVRYRKALTQRNAMLRADMEPQWDLMAIYEEEMALSGEAIYAARQAFVAEFSPIFRQIYTELCGVDERVAIQYRSHSERGALLPQLRSHRERERIVGYSLVGPHRDDLELLLYDFPIKHEGSQGQNKSFLVAMKLAQFDFLKTKGSRTAPILLLDDIFDKLDERRVEQIVNMVATNRFGQIFITDTNREYLTGILQRTGKEFRVFTVENGVITPTDEA